ncbi:uncharacterized protein LOC112539921 [Tetranychus urticae]|uniref:uncharacterized protein LOC112539921 n=1 Tax=Tetranychus urticae TaxID=32264 RepID=UPI000D6478B2|nr:uncharacterized protein LOC112539921 [Tetranychus urticae]
MIEELDGKDLGIKVLDNKFVQLMNRVMKLDESMSLRIFHDEHISDILFDSGRKVIRIDWNQNKYKLFDSVIPYYEALHALIIRSDFTEYDGLERITDVLKSKRVYGNLFSEGSEKFILVCGQYDGLFYSLTPKPESMIKSSCPDSFLATVLDNNIYMLSSDLEFIEFKIDSINNTLKRTYVHHLWSKKFKYVNLILTSSPAYDDRVILIDKITKDFFIFNINTRKWSSAIRMTNCFSDDKQKGSNKLFTFTSAFIPWNLISTYINLKPSKKFKPNH